MSMYETMLSFAEGLKQGVWSAVPFAVSKPAIDAYQMILSAIGDSHHSIAIKLKNGTFSDITEEERAKLLMLLVSSSEADRSAIEEALTTLRDFLSVWSKDCVSASGVKIHDSVARSVSIDSVEVEGSGSVKGIDIARGRFDGDIKIGRVVAIENSIPKQPGQALNQR
jgi:hypothetical protein